MWTIKKLYTFGFGYRDVPRKRQNLHRLNQMSKNPFNFPQAIQGSK